MNKLLSIVAILMLFVSCHSAKKTFDTTTIQKYQTELAAFLYRPKNYPFGR